MLLDAEAYAKQWIEAWNRRDLDAVLSHFADDVVFVSPKAQAFVGCSELHGKAELRAYWESALARITELQFTLDQVVVDDSRIAIVYHAGLNGVTAHAIELLTFNEQGKTIRGEAFYGATQT
jgi:uncharacterized protein (TIGR02246 family)